MTINDAWQEYGFGAVAKSYLSRLRPESGARREIDDNGDLLARRAGKGTVERQSLVAALKKPSWLDERTGGPKL
jgi:hypothetical protein